MLYLLSALSVMYIQLMYYISSLLLLPDGFVLCYIGLLVLTLWRFDDDVISPSPGKGRHTYRRYRRLHHSSSDLPLPLSSTTTHVVVVIILDVIPSSPPYLDVVDPIPSSTPHAVVEILTGTVRKHWRNQHWGSSQILSKDPLNATKGRR